MNFDDRMNLSKWHVEMEVRTLMDMGSPPPCEPQGLHSGCQLHGRRLYPLSHLVDVLYELLSGRILMGPTEESQ